MKNVTENNHTVSGITSLCEVITENYSDASFYIG